MNIATKAILTVCAVAGAATLQAQGVEKNVAFQYFATVADSVPAMRMESLGGKVVTGKPFSATEVRRTRQTLGDGTHIDKSEKDKYFRDSEGRTRIEQQNGSTVIITDPSTGATAETSNGKSRVMMTRGAFSIAGSAAGAGAGSGSGFAFTTAPSSSGEKTVTITANGPELHTELHTEMLDKIKAETTATNRVRVMSGTQDVFTRGVAMPLTLLDKGAAEDLGDQMINGVMARGTRNTITIPAGQIGNDREIKVISERWFSNDLGVLIKSTNNDPRFGETTFELMDILQGTQDPILFQMPSGAGNRR